MTFYNMQHSSNNSRTSAAALDMDGVPLSPHHLQLAYPPPSVTKTIIIAVRLATAKSQPKALDCVVLNSHCLLPVYDIHCGCCGAWYAFAAP